MTTPVLQTHGLTKTYPGVVANDDVSFSIMPGEIHALLGENGAGKSTLVKTIYGLVKPDRGHMLLNGVPYAPAEPRAARAAGVAMVFQHFSLFEALSVAENIALGMEAAPRPKNLVQQIREVSNHYGLPLDPNRTVGGLSAGERQRVEIIRCLLQNPNLLIMDEPTSVLTPQEVDILFQTLRTLRAGGTAILYISHKLNEINALCDTATILRFGKKVSTCIPGEVSVADMAELMVGQAPVKPARMAAAPGAAVLKVTNLSIPSSDPFGTPLRNIDFTVHAGEVLGIGGVAGNGQDELLAALSGETLTPPDTVMLTGRPIGGLGPNARRVSGLLCAPEERLGHAAAPDISLTENALMTARHRMGLAHKGFVDWHAARIYAATVIDNFDVRVRGPETIARALSGGNLQKFVIGREILQNPQVFVANQPTWGVDAAAAMAIRQALLDLAQKGAAIVVISQDLDELLEISHRFCALNDGRISTPRFTQDLRMEEIGLMLGGGHDVCDRVAAEVEP